MECYNPKKGKSYYNIIMSIILGNLICLILAPISNSYIIVNLIRVFMIFYTVYFIYFLVLSITVRYYITSEGIKIKSFFNLKSIAIKYQEIEAYGVESNIIKGVKISGVGNGKFAFGKTIVDKVGLTNMYVTNSHKVIYIKAKGINYGISPEDGEEVEGILKHKGIVQGNFEFKINRSFNLNKEKKFFIPFILVTIIIVYITINPFVLYLMNKLPEKMPLSFNKQFYPIEYGSGKQFAFRQMTYGVLNMIVLICMYYASYFYAKYDKKTAYKYIYFSLIIAFIFLVIQLKILNQFG